MLVKTTIEIADPLLKEAKRYAAIHELTLRQVMEAGLRAVLATPESSRRPFRLKKCTFKGKGMVKDFTWPEIRSAIYEGHGG